MKNKLAKWRSIFNGIFCSIVLTLNTLLIGILIYLFLPFKILSPTKRLRSWATSRMVSLAEIWVGLNSWFLRFFYHLHWDIEGINDLSVNKSYLISSNHRSWVDIPILQNIFYKHIPFIRFFLKKQLMYIPILGGAWWALDFPFMERHSSKYLKKHPEKKRDDFNTIKKACEKFRHTPISILNFLEGTRFSQAKHHSQNSPYPHLLQPKIGGIAYVLEIMGDQFDSLIDVTIYYPDGNPSLWGLLSGQLQKAIVRVQKWPIPKELIRESFTPDKNHREAIHDWILTIWKQKEQQLATLIGVVSPVISSLEE